MINIRTLRKLTNNDGLTLKAGKPITYKTGYQVATKHEALTIGREHSQISVLNWKTMGLVYC